MRIFGKKRVQPGRSSDEMSAEAEAEAELRRAVEALGMPVVSPPPVGAAFGPPGSPGEPVEADLLPGPPTGPPADPAPDLSADSPPEAATEEATKEATEPATKEATEPATEAATEEVTEAADRLADWSDPPRAHAAMVADSQAGATPGGKDVAVETAGPPVDAPARRRVRKAPPVPSARGPRATRTTASTPSSAARRSSDGSQS